MENIENKIVCLSLNSVWQPMGQKTVKEAICSLSNGDFWAVDISYHAEGDFVDFSKPKNLNPLNWQDWLKLPIREFDLVIRSPKLTVRVPTVIISKNYSKMPHRRLRLSASNVRLRDKNICQYSGKKLSDNEGSVDHIIPKVSGGEESWENLVFCDKKINLKKGRKSLTESGLKLLRTPREPSVTPAYALLTEAKHQDWEHFLIK